jgi:hypothetical protein
LLVFEVVVQEKGKQNSSNPNLKFKKVLLPKGHAFTLETKNKDIQIEKQNNGIFRFYFYQ